MLSILADALLIATRTDPVRRDLAHNQPDQLRDALIRRRWYQFAGLRG